MAKESFRFVITAFAVTVSYLMFANFVVGRSTSTEHADHYEPIMKSEHYQAKPQKLPKFQGSLDDVKKVQSSLATEQADVMKIEVMLEREDDPSFLATYHAAIMVVFLMIIAVITIVCGWTCFRYLISRSCRSGFSGTIVE